MSATLRRAHDLIAAGDLDAAKLAIDQAGGEKPDWFDYLSVRAGWHMRQRCFEDALGDLDAAVPFRPLDLTVHFNRGLCLYELGRYEDAAMAHQQGLKINPAFAKGWLKLGGSLLPLQHFAVALACYERAVGLDPNDAEVHIGLGTCISVFGDDAGAEAAYRRALELNPETPEGETALGFTLLRAGKWEEGWRRFEARWRLRPFGSPWDHQGAPLWTGSVRDLQGKTVLLRAEQGHGDTIQFARYIPLVAKRAKAVFVAVPASLERLVGSLGVMTVPLTDPMPEFDIQTSLMSLPLVFGTRVDRCPAAAEYRVAARTLPARVGICWHGGARPQEPIANADDKRRSIPWEMFAPIAEKVPCVSLQQEDLQAWGCADWRDTAEVIKGLDLVITVDTAVAHLAGSLGVPTWCLLRAGGCWRWLSSGERTVWYPSMRLYRQRVLSEWAPVVAHVVADLRVWAAKRAAA